jgi:hypothetical protein
MLCNQIRGASLVFLDLTSNPLATASALFGSFCLIASPLFSDRRTMLTVQGGIGLSFGLHYILLHAHTAAIVSVCGSVQASAAIFCTGRRKWLQFVIAVMTVVLGLAFWEGSHSIFAIAGTATIALGRMQERPAGVRNLFTAGNSIWLVHDLLIGSPIAVVDIFSICSGLYGAWTHRLSERSSSSI